MSTVKNLVKNFERGDATSKNSAVKDLVRRIDNKTQPKQAPPPVQTSTSPGQAEEDDEVETFPVDPPVEERSEPSPDITKEEEEMDEVDDDEDVEVSSTGTGPIIVDEIHQVPSTEDQQGVTDELEDP